MVKFNSGLIINWGIANTSGDGSTHTFPISFSNIIYNIQSSPRETNQQNGSIYWYTEEETLSSFKLVLCGNNWVVIGSKQNYIALGV